LIKYRCGEGLGCRHGVTFLVGAGFSASAGIPTAGQMVEHLLKVHPLLKKAGVTPPNQSEYAFLMSQLPPVERITIIREAIKKAVVS
jgi:NAD-dependent SIR2 family protein deacetylase